MDFRKAWIQVKENLELTVDEGQANGYDENSDTHDAGMYEAYKRVLDHMQRLESEEG